MTDETPGTEPQPSTAIERVPDRAPTPQEMAWKVATKIARTEFVPQSFQGKADSVFAAILYGQELGWGPMHSLNSLHVIKGKVTMAPEAMRSLIQGRGHSIVPRVMTGERCVMYGQRADTGDELEVEWTLDDARRAGLNRGDSGWSKYPRAMLFARATSELARALFADVIAGAGYTPGEIDGMAEPLQVEAEPVAVQMTADTVEPEIADAEIVVPAEIIDAVGSDDLATTKQKQRLAILAKELDLPDDYRHDLVDWITAGRTRTSKEMTGAEADTLVGILAAAKADKIMFTDDGPVGTTDDGKKIIADARP